MYGLDRWIRCAEGPSKGKDHPILKARSYWRHGEDIAFWDTFQSVPAWTKPEGPAVSALIHQGRLFWTGVDLHGVGIAAWGLLRRKHILCAVTFNGVCSKPSTWVRHTTNNGRILAILFAVKLWLLQSNFWLSPIQWWSLPHLFFSWSWGPILSRNNRLLLDMLRSAF